MGSCGVLPSLVYHFYHDQKYPKKTVIQGLKVAGLIGNLIQTNATISGAWKMPQAMHVNFSQMSTEL